MGWIHVGVQVGNEVGSQMVRVVRRGFDQVGFQVGNGVGSQMIRVVRRDFDQVGVQVGNGVGSQRTGQRRGLRRPQPDRRGGNGVGSGFARWAVHEVRGGPGRRSGWW